MKRVVGALNPKLDGFEASCFDGHYITGDVQPGGLRRSWSPAPLQAEEEDDNPLAAGAAERRRSARDPEGRPARRCAAGHAGRARGPAALALGRELRGAVPDQLLRAPRRRHRRARFANEEEAFVYSRFSNPTVTMMERRLAALEGTRAASPPAAAWRPS
jgi:hypothetical protein